MDAETLAGAAVMIGLGLLVVVVGRLGHMRRITFSLGGWTPETATPASWDEAHRVIGRGFVVGGSVAIMAGLVVLALSSDRVGPFVVAGCVLMLIPIVVAVVRGLGRLERR